MQPSLSRSLTRRALTRGLAALSAGFGAAGTAVASAHDAMAEAALRDAMLRGLALAPMRGDPVLASAAGAALRALETSDAEGALLVQIYRRWDPQPVTVRAGDVPSAMADRLATLHRAIGAARPVAFSYVDLAGDLTARSVLPLAVVHPSSGIKLLAWCQLRWDYRQFFVRAMDDVVVGSGPFPIDRLTLLSGLVAQDSTRV